MAAVKVSAGLGEEGAPGAPEMVQGGGCRAQVTRGLVERGFFPCHSRSPSLPGTVSSRHRWTCPHGGTGLCPASAWPHPEDTGGRDEVGEAGTSLREPGWTGHCHSQWTFLPSSLPPPTPSQRVPSLPVVLPQCQRLRPGLDSTTSRSGQNPAPILPPTSICRVTLGKSLPFKEPQCPHLPWVMGLDFFLLFFNLGAIEIQGQGVISWSPFIHLFTHQTFIVPLL